MRIWRTRRKGIAVGKPLPKLELEHWPIDDLQIDPDHPRAMDEPMQAALDGSVGEFGLVRAAVITPTGLVIDGVSLIQACRRQGITEVPVFVVELDAAHQQLLQLALNQIGGDWDEQRLAAILADLSDDSEIDLLISGFRDDEVEELIAGIGAEEKRDRPEAFEIDAATEAAFEQGAHTDPGDVYVLGEHRLICGDANDEAVVAVLLEGEPADLTLSDLPYRVNYGHHGGAGNGGTRTIINDNLDDADWLKFLAASAATIVSHTAGAIYCFMSSKEWPAFDAAMRAAGGHWSDTLIWRKDQFVLGRADYQRTYEPCWYGWPEDQTHYWCGDRNQSDVWDFARSRRSEFHPTQKPIELLERAIENSSRPGARIFDPFAGGGPALIAAERTGRRCVAIEIDPIFCDVIVARWEAFSGERAIRLPAAERGTD